jgi:hypothetical protein
MIAHEQKRPASWRGWALSLRTFRTKGKRYLGPPPRRLRWTGRRRPPRCRLGHGSVVESLRRPARQTFQSPSVPVSAARSSFLLGRSLRSFAEIQAEAVRWRDEVANARLHRTTLKRPVELFEQEKRHLRALPPRPYDTRLVRTVKATHQARVHFDSNTAQNQRSCHQVPSEDVRPNRRRAQAGWRAGGTPPPRGRRKSTG